MNSRSVECKIIFMTNRFKKLLSWGCILSPLFASQVHASLIAHFDFEEGAGTSTSTSDDSYTGTFTGDPTWVSSNLAPVPSGSNYAIAFDGTGDYLLTDYQGIAGSNARSVSFWVKTSAENNSAIVAWGDSASDGEKWHVRLNSSGSNGTLGAIRTEIQGSYEIGGPALDDGNWHHVVSVYSAGGTFGSGQVAHYVDGSLVSVIGTGDDNVTVNTTLSATLTGSASPVMLGGRQQDGSTQSFSGQLDEIRIYDHALSQAEITSLYVIPEPSTWALVLLAMFSLAFPRFRKRDRL
ncbi:LamG domain-containing protein [Kiritimatiellaeota bacterium B1221]|nr:LamG domain-containing protein [Kiritimatiellaeota bacterium B1221]